MEEIRMSKHEINQIAVFEKLIVKEIKQKHAAKILNLSTRQVRNKLKRFRQYGAIGLVNQSRGKPSNNKLDNVLLSKALKLVEEKYSDFGPTFASEKLRELHNITISHETLRLKMVSAGIWKTKTRKITHRTWRERKECMGELIQLDGSPHKWFEDRASECTLLAFIDDATSALMYMEFANEDTLSLMKATISYIKAHGLPIELYVDRGKVFKVNIHNEDNDKITQYSRALNELGIKIIYARSPQAKGRVERTFKTHQDRLVKELRIRNISTITKANKYLINEYIPNHNKKYAVVSKSSINLHRPIPKCNLYDIFCIKEQRIISNDFTVRYRNQWFQLKKQQKTLLFPKNEITINTHLDKSVTLTIRNVKLNYHKITKPVKQQKLIIKSKANMYKKPWKPSANHPWRRLISNDIKKQEISTLLKAEISTLV